jgi:NitT/TauT family transport system permease protein
MRSSNVWRRLLFYAALILGWEAIARLGIWPPYLLPGPSDVLAALARGVRTGALPLGIAISLRRLLIGFGISILIGVPLGLLLGRSRAMEETLGSLILGLQTLPSICWLPLALLWFGLSERAILFVVIMGAVLSITVSTRDGMKNIPPLFIRAARTMGAYRSKVYLYVILPAALPSILTGLKLGWSFAWRSLMAGELLYVSLGLGHLLNMGRELNDMSQVIAIMLVIIAIGLLVDRLVFAPIEQRVRERWGLARA